MGTRLTGPGLALLVAVAVVAGCASREERLAPSPTYEESTVKTAVPSCPTGYVLQCEGARTGRIRFGRIGPKNLESCACEEYRGMPTQSPLPGIW